MADEMGYQPKLKVGAAGGTASTTVEQAKDIAYSLQLQRGPTTVRGTGGNVPITTSNATQRTVVITWTMQNDPSDSVLATIIAACITGWPLALKLETGSGATLFDGDCTISKDMDDPLEGSSEYSFSAEPTKQSGRLPTLG
jgi:hypothetical protein